MFNCAQTVLQHFEEATQRFGLPSRVRCDHGVKNRAVSMFMLAGGMAAYSGHSPRHATKAGEHANLFGFKPSHFSMAGKRKKGKGFISAAKKRLKTTLWSKETICLRFMDQTKTPDTMEKMPTVPSICFLRLSATVAKVREKFFGLICPHLLRDQRVVVGGRRSGRPWLGPGLV